MRMAISIISFRKTEFLELLFWSGIYKVLATISVILLISKTWNQSVDNDTKA